MSIIDPMQFIQYSGNLIKVKNIGLTGNYSVFVSKRDNLVL